MPCLLRSIPRDQDKRSTAGGGEINSFDVQTAKRFDDSQDLMSSWKEILVRQSRNIGK
jgi:hypothetical protein